MNTTKNTMVTTVALALLLLACKKPATEPEPQPTNNNGTLKVNLIAKFNGQPYTINQAQSVINISGYSVQVEVLKFFLYDLRTKTQAGMETQFKDAAKIDFINGNPSFTAEVQPGNYQGIKFGIGVGPDKNNSDPTVLAPDHPLSINQAQDMHWNWNTGYIFMKFEGRVDTASPLSGNHDLLFSFHTGNNALYREVELYNHPFTITTGNTTNLNLVFNIDKFFYNTNDTLDLKTDHSLHAFTVTSLGTRVADISVGIFTLE
jgi:hypothetical protein